MKYIVRPQEALEHDQPKSHITIKEIGVEAARIATVAVPKSFSSFTKEAITQMRAEIIAKFRAMQSTWRLVGGGEFRPHSASRRSKHEQQRPWVDKYLPRN
ncbi:hypothetical protein HRR83_006875 [Exophiala dermatitidis]|uniref:Uncharacterized protein n=1 Tax=Exophiala dermatitidis TaxID=5970 RepID=A0AAN6IT92_EXODE|nr:hypothetical protein HRR73_005914 [Exophiala dermatitidis]KAJ4512765.1 hypothetical protein HRR74_006463 [Exophiala dermatitidis]KAJ4542572.1 hypothetical protein HRR77_005769 [Exophiala dermatitidis]KAJ4548264.1 hypothetical protein HRR76_000868 [Exophiala dermatitidis]KAJ4570206.1 hypothetical protein HRR82_007417 [Exophiala dermatitidis]